MPLHRKPQTLAGRLALHLETQYGLQLDPARHEALISELNGFLAEANPPAQPAPPQVVEITPNTPDAEALGYAEYVPQLDKAE